MKKKINLRELKLKRLRFKRLTYRSSLILLGIIATIIIAFNFWFIDHAKDTLEQIVYNQSKGKLRLKVSDFKFNWIRNKIELDTASIISTDSTAPVLYSVNTDRITIKARGFLPLLFRKQILIDSIRLHNPNIVFTRIEEKAVKSAAYKDSVKSLNGDDKFSVAREMGRITQSITDAINVLQVSRFALDNGSFSLIDRTKPAEAPFIVNRIYVQLENLKIDISKTNRRGEDRKFNFTDNIAIRTSDQNISFPGGRHFLSFKNFRVNLQHKRVEFDSCTLRAIKGDSSKTSFRIFFDKLALTNINFDSLYSRETLIADSVYCNNPQIFLDIDSDLKTAKNSKDKPKIQKVDDLVQQLLGDLRLGYVGVTHADIAVNTIKKKKTSTFSSTNNNFEIYGLVVRQDKERPINLNKFVMSLHHSENLIRDGRYEVSFDSIGFEDDVINLSEFSFKEFDKGRTVKSLSMPNFQISGLSWESLLYNNTFAAERATFYKPLVDYTTSGKRKKQKSKNIFTILNNIDDVMDLNNLEVQQGDITLRFGRSASLHLENANLDLRAEELTNADHIKSAQRSVKTLNFDKGTFKKGDLTALLNNVRLSENKSGILAGSLLIRSNHLNAGVNNINIGSVVLDSSGRRVIVDGVDCSNATLEVDNAPKDRAKKTHKKNASLVLRNIHGLNTRLDIAVNQNKITGSFNDIILKEFAKNGKDKPEIRGLSLDGQNFLMLGHDTRVAVRKMDITDRHNSVLRDIEIQKINQVDSIVAIVPALTIIPNITEIVSGNLTLNGLILTDPVIDARLGKKENPQPGKKKPVSMELASALLQRPEIHLAIENKNDSSSYISWEGSKFNSFLKLTNFKSTPEIPVKADQIKVFLTNFEFISAKNKKYATNDNKLNLEFNDVLVKKNGEHKIDWQTNVNILSLDKLYFDSLGKNNAVLELDKGDVRNITLNSRYVNNIGSIITSSKNLHINATNGSFLTGKNKLEWYGFTAKNRILGVDSFNLTPNQSVEDYRIAKAFNEDYLRVHSGKIVGGPVDLEKYSNDSILSIGHIDLNDIDLFTFKDKTQPDTAKKYKPLPAEMLLKLKNSLDIDSIRLKNMHVTYWEINPQTDTLGAISVSELNALICNVKNYNIKNTDSIYITAAANVLDHLYTTLNVSQSYADTPGYIAMRLTTGPMDLTRFNTVLVPLVGAKVFRGNLNRMIVEASGDNNAMTGSARMYYQDLNVGLLNKKDLPHQTFMNKLLSRIAMALIIRKDNQGKRSLVFFERWQDKSPVNYIIKTSLEGIKSGIGLPGAKKKFRKYRKKLNIEIPTEF
ncbi:MAG: hypothetical protein QM640_03505 [Niabella sp.]